MIRDIIGQAYGAMHHNRRRTALTMLGMAWGIATVVLLLAYGSGFGRAIEMIFASFGAKVIGVFPGQTSMQAGGQKAGVKVRLRLDDIERLKTNVPEINHISPEVQKQCAVQYENRSFTFSTHGYYPNIQRIQVMNLEDGRFFNGEDDLQHARVVVLGSEAKEKLFSGKNAVGDRIRIDGASYEVIGVMQPKMQEGDSDINRQLYIPFNTMGDVKNTEYIDGVWLDYEGNDWSKIEQSVRTILGTQHNFNPKDRRAVFVFAVMEQLDQFHIISLALTVLLGFIGTLTLGIGGVGLMNIMLVSVNQRTREIGVEKALGARKRDILLQFLSEALAITGLGGLLGIVLSYIISFSVGKLTLYSALAKHAEAADISLTIQPSTLIAATVILAFVGICSGMIPAIRASRLDPIEALRYE